MSNFHASKGVISIFMHQSLILHNKILLHFYWWNEYKNTLSNQQIHLWLVCCFVQWLSFVLFLLLEQCCCKKQQKSARQETDLGDRGSLKFLNDNKLVLSHLRSIWYHSRSIWYHSEPLGVPYSSNQFLALDFFCCFLQQDSSKM